MKKILIFASAGHQGLLLITYISTNVMHLH